MIKGLIISAAIAASVFAANSATAATINLGPVECGILKQCVNIPNDAGKIISLYGAPGYPFFYVYIDGTQYTARQPSGDGVIDAVLIDIAGDVAYLTASFTTYTTCIRSGRGQHCSQHWSLVSGGTVTQ